MKARVATSVEIAAKPAEVFKYLADLQYHPLWNPNLKKISPHVLVEEGLVYRTTSLLFGTKIGGKIEVMRIVPDKTLEICSTTGMLEYKMGFYLQEDKGGTVVKCRTTVSTESKMFAFARPMMGLLARREVQADLDALKNAVEQKLEPNPASKEK